VLNIYPVSQDVVRSVMPIARKIKEHNKDLANQLERAVVSVPLNLAEGSGQRDGNRTQRYLTALGSAREVRAALETAISAGYVDAHDTRALDWLDRIIATLVKVLGLHRARTR